MASLTRKPNGSCVIGFTDPDGRPRWLYAGTMPRKAAESILRHVEALLAAKVAGSPVPVDTARWLSEAGETLHKRLVKAGLATPRVKPESRQLKALCDSYLAKRTDIKPRTVESLRRAATSLVAHFGADRDYATITKADAADWKRAGLTKLSRATVANDVVKARQIFADAVNAGLITSNPFTGVKAGSMVNPARLHYVPAAVIEKVMATCGPEWALAFALARYGGLRCPSETSALKWPDVDWDRQRIAVTSPKGERHGKGTRVIPLFPELYPPLLRAWEAAADKSGHVLPTLGSGPLGTAADRIIRRAGLETWERTFQNLRASRETDLARVYPIQVVCAWIGNTPAVAVAHYLSVLDADYQSAAGAVNGAAPATAVSTVLGERPLNTGGGTTERALKIAVPTFLPRIGPPLETRGIFTPTLPALDFALSAFPPDTSAVALHQFAEQIYARAAARAEGTVARG